MTLNKLIQRLQDIRDNNPGYGDLTMIFAAAREVPDRRKHDGVRREQSYHSIDYGCNGRIGGVIDSEAIELMGTVIKDWR
jgi:hypothetical protein